VPKLLAAITAGFLVALVASSAQAASKSDIAAITAAEHKLAEATSAAEAMPFFAPGNVAVQYDITPDVFQGYDAIKAHLVQAYALSNPLKVDFKALTIDGDGSIIYAYSIQHFTGTWTDGKALETTVRQTDIWRKIDGRWLIVHQHASFPVDVTTGKAVMSSP
jgi:ketosteroid isomerase-like protein